MSPRPTISIVMPCRNGAAFIGATLRAALNQTEPPAEIIVIDDGSTDETRAIAEGFGGAVTVHAGPAQGAAVARNTGAALARSDRIMFLDADDLLTPGTLAALGAALDNAPEQALAICPWDRLEQGGDPDDPLAPWLVHPASNALPRPGQDPLAAWLTGTWSPPCCILWSRAGYEASGGWWQPAGLDDDGNLVRRALARGIAMCPAPGGLALYRRLPGEMVSYSGRRTQPWGIEVRLASLTDTVAALETSGRLTAYRAPMMENLAQLRSDAAPHPEFAVNIAALARRIGGARLWDLPVAVIGRAAARAAAAWRERRTPVQVRQRDTAPSAPTPVTDGPLVSVVIPTFNRAELVMIAVRSVLNQNYGNLELIVVDDGSTDNTAARLTAIDDSRLRVIRKPNGGVARARNAGIDVAQGELLACLDSDDAWRPGKLAAQVAALDAAGPQAGICHTGIEMQVAGRTVDIRHPHLAGEALSGLLITNPVHSITSGGLVRRAVFDAVGGFDPTLPAVEDWDWLQRAARLTGFVAVDAPLTVYRDDDTASLPRRSRAFRRNMQARAMLWNRNRHALRRIGVGHLFLLESARRELREPQGDAARGRILVLRALAERPQARAIWPWLGYMCAPAWVRAWLRDRDAAAHAARRAKRVDDILPD